LCELRETQKVLLFKDLLQRKYVQRVGGQIKKFIPNQFEYIFIQRHNLNKNGCKQTAVKQSKKNTATIGELIAAECALVVCVYISCT
jgi:hypothetical protein